MMGDKGKRDKGKRQAQKIGKDTLKEKRKKKNEKNEKKKSIFDDKKEV